MLDSNFTVQKVMQNLYSFKNLKIQNLAAQYHINLTFLRLSNLFWWVILYSLVSFVTSQMFSIFKI